MPEVPHRKLPHRKLPHRKLPHRIGIVAGWGSFPVEVAETLRSDGHQVYVVGLRGHADPKLNGLATAFATLGVLKIGAHLRFFKRHRVEAVVFAGKIFKDKVLYDGLGWISHLPDLTCYRILGPSFVTHRKDGRDDTVLGAVVDEYIRQGMPILPITDVDTKMLIKEGNWTNREMNRSSRLDAEFGWSIARAMGGMDIGQSITVKDQIVLGVEAIEGTDALIQRTGKLCPRGGFTLIKVAKPQQDLRFDVPTIGRQTVEQMIVAGGRNIVVEADKTIFVDRDETLALANDHGIRIVAMKFSDTSKSNSTSETLTSMTYLPEAAA